jgi:uncharacterized phage protein (TIGR01671 family)
MRDYLFRGKRPGGYWVYGYYFRFSGSSTPYIKYTDNQGEHTVAVDPDTVGLCSNLSDMNDVNIFEGDIVSYWDGTLVRDPDGDKLIEGKRYKRNAHKIAIVVFTKGCFRLIDNNPLSCFMDKGTELLVIGNIHDNNELLLEKGKQ